jgi:hypothetical protein
MFVGDLKIQADGNTWQFGFSELETFINPLSPFSGLMRSRRMIPPYVRQRAKFCVKQTRHWNLKKFSAL